MLSVIKKFGKLFDKRQKNRVVILFFMMVIGAFLEVLGVSLMLPLITAIMQQDIMESNELIRRICGILHIQSHREFVITCIMALIVIFIIKDFYLMLQYYVQYRFVYHNRFHTQRRLLWAFMKRPYEYYLSAQTGEILRIIQGDVVQTYSLFMTLLAFATESIVSIALIITIFVVDPVMTTFVAVMMLGIIIVITKVIKPIQRREGLAFQKQSTLTNKWLLQALYGIKVVKVTHKEAFFEENYNKSGREMIRTGKLTSVLNSFPRLLIEMVSVCSMLVLIAIMICMGRDISRLMPAIGAFAMAALKLMPSANRIVNAVSNIAFQEPALDQMLLHMKMLDEENLRESGTKKSMEKKPELMLKKEIVLQNITYCYPHTEKKILEHAQMVIPVGKSVGIVGISGVGKTTVADIMLGLLKPQEGQILADGVDVMTNYQQWLSHIGYIPQNIFLMDDSVRENIAFGIKPEEQCDEQLWNVLEEAQLAEFVRSLPEGLNTKIGEYGVRLSGGQRQRIGIARALYANPKLLIFDEATSSLDHETEAAIMESIHSLHGKKTIVIIAHRLQTIEGCDMVYRVKDGKIERE